MTFNGYDKQNTPIRKILAEEGLQFYQWSNRPGNVYSAHSHSYHKVIWVLQGSIIFGLSGRGDKVILNACDRLELPAFLQHMSVNQGCRNTRIALEFLDG